MLAAGEQVPVSADKKKEEEKVLRREEKISELQKRKMMHGRAKKAYKGGYNFRNQMNQGFNQFAEEAENNKSDQFDKINGEKVLREYGANGLRNAVHFIISQPQKSMFEFVLSLGINADQPDYDEVTPFNLMSINNFNSLDQNHQHMLKKFLSMDVRIDFPNRKGRTPFLNFYEKQNFELATQMLDLGANVNQMDNAGLFALKYALIRRQNASI